jgi:hypothetical protein
MNGPFGDWLSYELTIWGTPLQNWMIPVVAGVTLYCLFLWHRNRRLCDLHARVGIAPLNVEIGEAALLALSP